MGWNDEGNISWEGMQADILSQERGIGWTTAQEMVTILGIHFWVHHMQWLALYKTDDQEQCMEAKINSEWCDQKHSEL